MFQVGDRVRLKQSAIRLFLRYHPFKISEYKSIFNILRTGRYYTIRSEEYSDFGDLDFYLDDLVSIDTTKYCITCGSITSCVAQCIHCFNDVKLCCECRKKPQLTNCCVGFSK